MLEADRIGVAYGAAQALWDVSLTVGPGELACVVGPNGAGKSTLINAVAGLNRICAGSLRFDGVDLARLPAHRFCATGIAIVPESRRLFTAMSVRENLELGSLLPEAKAQRRESLERVCGLLPALSARLDAPAGARKLAAFGVERAFAHAHLVVHRRAGAAGAPDKSG